LLQSYEQDVTTIFEQNTPEPDKQLVKDFRGLTHDFEKVVFASIADPDLQASEARIKKSYCD